MKNLSKNPSVSVDPVCARAVAIVLHLAVATTGWALDDLTMISDEFDDAASLGHWSRIHESEGWNNDVLEIFDSNTTRPGHLVMTPYSSSWFEEYRGELTYKLVSGDFVITTHVEPRNRAGTGRPERDYSLAGIMVRAPRSMTDPSQWTPDGQNYVFLSMGSASRASSGFEYEVKTTINSQSTLIIQPTGATRATIQVARIGPHLIMLRRDEGGSWVVHRRYRRDDFPETLQAGLTVYTDWPTCATVGFENNNRLVLTNGVELLGGGSLDSAQPDLVAAFEFVRYARPEIPEPLIGADLSNSALVTDGQLLSFLGSHANIPGGAATPPSFENTVSLNGSLFEGTANVMSNRTYRLQSAPDIDGIWTDLTTFVTTNNVQDIEETVTDDNLFFRLTSP